MSKNKRLTLEERKTIEELLHKNVKHKEICEKVKINPSTLYRDFRKCQGAYSAEEAHKNTCRGFHPIDWKIIGKRFGLLTVIQYANKYKGISWWKCRCDCGQICIISRKILIEYCSPDRMLSCGCIAKEHKGNGEKVPIEEARLRKYQDLLAFRKMRGDCWEWTGYRQNGKTPKTSWKNKALTVRKCMYLLMNDTSYEPNPVFVKCGNLLCFNPDHITLQRPDKRQYYE